MTIFDIYVMLPPSFMYSSGNLVEGVLVLVEILVRQFQGDVSPRKLEEMGIDSMGKNGNGWRVVEPKRNAFALSFIWALDWDILIKCRDGIGTAIALFVFCYWCVWLVIFYLKVT